MSNQNRENERESQSEAPASMLSGASETEIHPEEKVEHSHAGTDAKHDHADGMACCSHHEQKLERWLVVYLAGGALVLCSTIMGWFGVPPEVRNIPAFFGATVLAMGLVVPAIKELWHGRPSTSSLAALAILAMFSIGDYAAAGYVAFILLVFDQAFRRTAWGAQRAIEELVGLTPDIARIIENGVEREVPLSEVKVGTVVRVRPGENLPVDGVIVSGESSINQASLTGEALPVEVGAGAEVYAGTTNINGTIELRTTQVGGDTTIGKVAELISEAESTRTPRQLVIEQVARYFVPVAIVTSALVWYMQSAAAEASGVGGDEAVLRAITVLIAVCPAALLIAGPITMTCAFTAAARLGIMIKQSQHLEAAANCDTFVFDKTGTMTTGKFAVSRLAPAEGVNGAELLKAAADAEQASNHPLARSIMHTAQKAKLNPASDVSAEEIHGAGVRAKVGSGEILAGRPNWLIELFPGIAEQIAAVEAQIEGMSGVHVVKDGRYLGAVGLEDRLRYNTKGVIEKLRELGSRSIVLMTGDRFAVAKRVGKTVKVDRIEAECLPEDKHRLVRQMTADGRRVLMVGDGINDGPSLAAADVGVAMGLHGSDIATNTAGIALMTDDISRVPFLVMLARRSRVITVQNVIIAVVSAIVGLVLAASGVFTAIKLGVIGAAVFHFIPEVLVLLNSARLLRFGEEFSEQENFQAAASTGAMAGSPTPAAPAPQMAAATN
ncbi:MAG: heavy metal translocating P-type ATPase [Phycisphaerales bacterium JB050]